MGARSKGCISCKARRVKCDEAHPHCQRCQKAGLACKGYEPLKWVDERERVRQLLVSAREQAENYAAVQNSSFSMYHTSQLKSHHTRILSRNIPKQLTLSSFKNSIVMSFLASKLYDDSALVRGRRWMLEMPGKFNYSLNALAYLIFGHMHCSSIMVQEGRHLYGKAIMDLRLNLLEGSTAEDFGILGSVTALCMYEVSHAFGWNRNLLRVLILAAFRPSFGDCLE